MQESPGFKWNIDELARIKPAKIEEFPAHQIQSPDPELEIKAQAAIDRFFKQNRIIPSPWDIRQKENKLSLDTPNRPLDDLNSTKDPSKSKKDGKEINTSGIYVSGLINFFFLLSMESDGTVFTFRPTAKCRGSLETFLHVHSGWSMRDKHSLIVILLNSSDKNILMFSKGTKHGWR